MSESPVRVPDNFDELQERLRNGWAKGKAGGASNTALNNTSKMLVELFLQKESKKITPYQQAVLDQQKQAFEYQKQKDSEADWKLIDTDGDGVMEWVNTNTRSIESTSSGNGLEKYEDNPSVPVPGQPLPNGTGPSGLTGDEQQALIDSLGQGDTYGVLGTSSPVTLEKGPGYMQPEDEKRAMFAAQEQPLPIAEASKPIDLSKGAIPLAAGKAWNLLKMVPSTAGKVIKAGIENQRQGSEEFTAGLFGDWTRGKS